MLDRLTAPPLPDWLAAELPFSRYTVRAAGRTVHVMEQGEGVPVLLVHGNPTWGFLWRKVARALAGARLRLVMPDLVGLGLSEHPGADFHTLENHGQVLAALIEGLGLDAPVFVCQDWGGAIGGLGLSLAGVMPRAVVAMNTVLGPPREGFRPTAFHRFARMPVVSDLAFRALSYPQRALHLAQGDRGSIRGATAKAYRWPLSFAKGNAAPLALARMVPDSLEHPSIAPLKACEAFLLRHPGPQEVVWGDRDPVLGRAFKRLHATLPRANVTHTQAGHFLQEEVPDDIAAAIRRAAG
ncbi:MAG: alpha/beta fold hydrolase [Myxococcaceae bacterium]|nr:alpha/beta fold hydrolase [Myxococcaceae bacterium]